MPKPTHLKRRTDYLCRHVLIGNRDVGLSIVGVGPRMECLSVAPFMFETPETIYFDGKIVIAEGRVTLVK